jgi:biuret amidohydrolase
MGPHYELRPETTALLVIDMTNDFALEGSAGEIPAGRDIVPQVRQVIDACHASGAPVIFISHVLRPDGSDVGRMADIWLNLVDDHGRPAALLAGSPGVDVVPDLTPGPHDLRLEKHRASAFFERELDTVLRGLGVSTVIVTGMATNGCCLATALDAGFRGYRVVFASDATATSSLPDVGFGEFTADECQRMTLATVAFSIGEVTSARDIAARLGGNAPATERVPTPEAHAI